MKKMLLFLLVSITIFTSNLKAQYFGEVGTIWGYNFVSYFPMGPDYSAGIESTGTAIIQGKTCNVLENIGNHGCMGTEGSPNYVYYEDGIVYWYNEYLQTFTTLYDFNAEAGDTWDILVENCTITMEVDSVSSVVIGNDTLKVLHPNSTNGTFEGAITERLGMRRYLFPSYADAVCGLICDGNYTNGFKCYQDDFIFYTNNPDSLDCLGFINPTLEVVEAADLSVFPTISSGLFHLELNSVGLTIDQIDIVGVDGRHKKGWKNVKTSQLEVNIDGNGVYFIFITLSNGERISRKVVVQG